MRSHRLSSISNTVCAVSALSVVIRQWFNSLNICQRLVVWWWVAIDVYRVFTTQKAFSAKSLGRILSHVSELRIFWSKRSENPAMINEKMYQLESSLFYQNKGVKF